MRSQLFASPAALRTLGLTGLCFLVCLVGAARTGLSQALSDSDLVTIQFQQKLGAQVPLGLRFTDETGRSVRLSEYLGTKPIVLVPGYYGCPMLCTMVLNGLVESMQDMKWQLGRDFEVINYSIDPRETPSLANAKKQTYAKRYGRAGTDVGWHFLTGREDAIRALSTTIGFGYRLDPATGQYAHPSGIVVLTPQGKVAHYLFGVTFSSRDVYGALKEASSERIGSPIQKLILLCFHYNPLTGKYSPTILGFLRIMSVATVLGLIGLVAVTIHRSRAA
jgi:protein SCO1